MWCTEYALKSQMKRNRCLLRDRKRGALKLFKNELLASDSETSVILYENIGEIFCPKYSRHVVGKITTT